MHKIVFELCADTIDACFAAQKGGAHRIELCSGLSEGGVTPSLGFVRAAVEQSQLPIHVLVRPRAGNFFYSESEVAIMVDDILCLKKLGAAGVVFGLLQPDSTVDVEGTRRLVELAHPMKVTFHRAFDATPSLPEALEEVILTGCDRVLTSGGQRDVVAGAQTLAELVIQARGRIDVALGGGLRLQNATSLSRLTQAKHFHGSLRRRVISEPVSFSGGRVSEAQGSFQYVVDPETVREIMLRLQNA